MKRSKTLHEAPDLAPIFSDYVTRNISTGEAKIFWQNRRTEGKIDALFKRVQERLKLLWQKIKDGSATDQEYTTAFLLVCDKELEGQESSKNNNNLVDELSENKHQSPKGKEELANCSNSLFEEDVTHSDPEANDTALPFSTENIDFVEHACGQECLSDIHPYLSRRENPLWFPIMCGFHRWHAKSGVLSRPLDVIYKTPCGKSLRDFDDVHNYLCETECDFLFLEHFSFNTYLQLDRHPINIPAVAEEADLSRDAESVPISFCNEIDSTMPSPFTYRKTPWPHGYSLNNFTDLFLGCCDCTDGCLDVSTCTCLQLTEKECNKNDSSPKKAIPTGYKHKRLQAPIPTGIYECNVSCQCDRRMCQNRVVQHGLQARLQVYKTEEKGWGVRCEDDLDKGSFVCIYAGRILITTVDIDAQQSSSPSAIHNDSEIGSIYTKRKRCGSRSDSEILILPSNSCSSRKPRDTPLTLGCSRHSETTSRNTSSGSIGGNVTFTSIRRPKTKTAILQKRRRQQLEKTGTIPVQHSSDDDDFFAPDTSLKLVQESRLRSQGVQLDDEDDDDEDDKMMHTEKLDPKRTHEAGYLSDNRTLPIHVGEGPLHQTASKKKPQPQDCDENVCVLDASKEGNVARFFNHSCSPNLFVQHVFVESHAKKFPWVAFFTKSHIKAGTELTWEYNYDIGSVPEMEIPCLCGHKTCKNITI